MPLLAGATGYYLVNNLTFAPQVAAAEKPEPEKAPVPKDVTELIADLKGKDDAARLKAAIALADFGPAAKPAIPVLVASLKRENDEVRLTPRWHLPKSARPPYPS